MQPVERAFTRAAEAIGAYGHMRVPAARIDKMALAQVSALAADQHLDLFARWCYQKHDGLWLNILPSGQIPSGAWTPWGGSGKSRMTRLDRDILRRWLVGLQERRHFPPWVYHGDERRWYVDIARYDNVDEVLHWLTKHHINPRDWLTLRLSMQE